MTAQRDRLAALIREAGQGLVWSDELGEYHFSSSDLADALLARGVRVVDADTLAALPTHVPAGHEWECVSCNYKNNKYVTDDGRPCALDYDVAIGRDDLYAALEVKP